MKPRTRSRLLEEMEFYFGKDKKRINHAHQVLEFAEQILRNNDGSTINRLVVTAAAVLHDIGIHACEKKYGSTEGHLQEKEGPPIARHIMERLNFKEEIIKEVCDIIANHHSPGKADTLNFKILYDADWLVNLEGETNTKNIARLKKKIDNLFLTNKGREIAKKIYLLHR